MTDIFFEALRCVVRSLRLCGFGVVMCGGLSFASRSLAADFLTREAIATDGIVQCFAHRDWLVTVASGPCNSFVPPAKVAVGERFSANGKQRVIGLIRVTQADKDIKGYGLDIKRGEMTCIAGETPADLDIERNDSALWLYIPKCQATTLPTGMIQPFTVTEFLEMPPAAQAIYLGGVMEGMAFLSYSYAPTDYQSWANCARSKTLGDTVNDVVAFARQTPEFHESVASALAQVLGRRCKH